MLSIEKIECDTSATLPCDTDVHAEDTVRQLSYISDRFGPLSSWSSARITDSWNLNIQRKSGKQSLTKWHHESKMLLHC